MAVAAVFGDMSTYATYTGLNVWMQTVEQETLAAARADREVGSAATAWSACMHESGFEYADPSVPANTSWSNVAHEKRIAVADATCRASSGYTTALAHADGRAQQAVVDKDGETIRLYRSTEDAALAKLRQLTTG